MKKIKIKDLYKKTNYTFLKLEELIEKCDLTSVNIFDLCREFNIESVIYLIDALRMPKEEINKIIEMIDSTSSFNADTLVFNLSKKYNVDKTDVIRRIGEVRILNKNIHKRKPNKQKNLKRTKQR